MPIQFGSIANIISHEAKLVSLPSPNLEALAPSANLTPTSEVTDGVANTVPVPKGTNKVLSREAGTEALYSAKYLRSKTKSKAPQHAKSEVTMTLLPKFSGAKLVSCGRATRLTSPSEDNITDKVIFKSPKNRSLKARGLQPEQPLQVNTDLREFLTNK